MAAIHDTIKNKYVRVTDGLSHVLSLVFAVGQRNLPSTETFDGYRRRDRSALNRDKKTSEGTKKK